MPLYNHVQLGAVCIALLLAGLPLPTAAERRRNPSLLVFTSVHREQALDIWALTQHVVSSRGYDATVLIPDHLAREGSFRRHDPQNQQAQRSRGSLDVLPYPSVAFEEYQPHGRGAIAELTAVLDFHLANCAGLLLNRTLVDLLTKQSFTAILGAAMDPCSTFLADKLLIRRRAAYDDGGATSLLWGVLLGAGHPTSHVAAYGSGLGGGAMTVRQRLTNLLQYGRLQHWHRSVYGPRVAAFRRRHRLPAALALPPPAPPLTPEAARAAAQQAAAAAVGGGGGGGPQGQEAPKGTPCHLRGQVIITGADWGLVEPQMLPPQVKLVGPLRAAAEEWEIPAEWQHTSTPPAAAAPAAAALPPAAAAATPGAGAAAAGADSKRDGGAPQPAAAAVGTAEAVGAANGAAASAGAPAGGQAGVAPEAAAAAAVEAAVAAAEGEEGPAGEAETEAEAALPPLPPDLAAHVAAAERGVAVIAFPPDYRPPLRALLAIAEAVLDLRVHIVWQAPEADIARVKQLYLPLRHARHVLMLPTLPLRALLAQPRVVSLITDGSVQALYAAIHAAKPVMAVPLSRAQEDLVARLAAVGAGQRLSRAELEGGAASYRVSVAIERMRNVYSYTAAMQQLSTQLRATRGSVPPLEAAAQWVQYTASLDPAGRQFLTPRSALPGAGGGGGGGDGGGAPAAGGGGGCMGPAEAANAASYGAVVGAGVAAAALTGLVIHVCTRVPAPPAAAAARRRRVVVVNTKDKDL